LLGSAGEGKTEAAKVIDIHGHLAGRWNRSEAWQAKCIAEKIREKATFRWSQVSKNEIA
jgi:hypothetical protein